MNNITLSPHFKLNEFTKSETANRLGLKNEPTAEALVNLTALCHEVLEPLRRAVKKAIVINSGYRSEAVNKAVGGVSNSQHMKGEAVDLSASRGADNTDLLGIICTFSNYDQPTDYTNAKGQVQFIHASLKRDGKTSRSPDDSCRKKR